MMFQTDFCSGSKMKTVVMVELLLLAICCISSSYGEYNGFGFT